MGAKLELVVFSSPVAANGIQGGPVSTGHVQGATGTAAADHG